MKLHCKAPSLFSFSPSYFVCNISFKPSPIFLYEELYFVGDVNKPKRISDNV